MHLLSTPDEVRAISRLIHTFARNDVGLFNGRHGRTGTLWEERYKACVVDSGNYFLACSRYVELNPVRAWIVARPDEHPWSSDGADAVGRVDPLLTPHGEYVALGTEEAARADAYRALFAEALPGFWCGKSATTSGSRRLLGRTGSALGSKPAPAALPRCAGLAGQRVAKIVADTISFAGVSSAVPYCRSFTCRPTRDAREWILPMQTTLWKGWLVGAFLPLALSACSSSHMEPLDVQGSPTMVDDAGQKRLWVLGKQEEVRQVGAGGASRRTTRFRSDTFFHFTLQAFDPVTASLLWSHRVLTLGDDDTNGTASSRVIGSDAEAKLLGQNADMVWLLVGNAPIALSAHDGRVMGDAAEIERRNPALKGLLPSEAKYYSFDRGLVLMTADARPLVIRGETLEATDYVPAPVSVPEPDHYANGRQRSVPLVPYGAVPARQAKLGGQWLGLYTQGEAIEASNDPYGNRLRYPYSVPDEGSQARRTFWRGKIVQVQDSEDNFLRLESLQPIAGSPVLLKGRFVKDPVSGNPLLMQAPEGVLVWSITHIDQAGRLALTRLDAELKTVWKAELPLSEEGTGNVVSVWLLPGRLVAMGEEDSVVDGVRMSDQHLVSVDLDSGQWQGWDMPGERALPVR